MDKILCFIGFHDEYLNLVPTKLIKIKNTDVITPELFDCEYRLKCEKCGKDLTT